MSPFHDITAGGYMRKIFAAAFLAAFLVGCQTTPTTQDSAPIDDKTAAGVTPGAATSGATGSGVTGSSSVTLGAVNPLRDPNNMLSKRNIYFDFDSFVVREEFKPLVEAHARFLQQNRNAKMTIQGNPDERG